MDTIANAQTLISDKRKLIDEKNLGKELLFVNYFVTHLSRISLTFFTRSFGETGLRI